LRGEERTLRDYQALFFGTKLKLGVPYSLWEKANFRGQEKEGFLPFTGGLKELG